MSPGIVTVVRVAGLCAGLLVGSAASGCSRDVYPFSRTDGSATDAAAVDATTHDATAVRDAGDVQLAPRLLSAGYDHVCAILSGELYCWGKDDFDALGLGPGDDTTNQPVRVGSASDWSAVSAGGNSTCGMRGTSVYCWGRNEDGQLGLGDLVQRAEPTLVPVPSPVEHISVGEFHACAIASDGRLYCWGSNAEGHLGLGDPVDATDPYPTPTLTGDGRQWASVSAGGGHTCAIERGGALYCWGRNGRGELGQGDGASTQLRLPTRVPGGAYLQVTAEQLHTCGLDADRVLSCWGHNPDGRLGVGDTSDRTIPTAVATPRRFDQVESAWFATCAIASDGSFHAWGRNYEGQLGLLDRVDRSVPSLVDDSARWIAATVGRFMICAADDGARIACAGLNVDGQLGTADNMDRTTLTPVVFPGAI